jgi:hypothetical protein
VGQGVGKTVGGATEGVRINVYFTYIFQTLPSTFFLSLSLSLSLSPSLSLFVSTLLRRFVGTTWLTHDALHFIQLGNTTKAVGDTAKSGTDSIGGKKQSGDNPLGL